jgi:hypothetical protein
LRAAQQRHFHAFDVGLQKGEGSAIQVAIEAHDLDRDAVCAVVMADRKAGELAAAAVAVGAAVDIT